MSTAKEVRDLNAEKQKNVPVTNVSNYNSEVNNPCIKEQKLSHKCLSENNYDHDMCRMHFINYNSCKDFWYQISIQRRKKGIKPYLPPPEERPAVIEGYVNANK